MKSHSPSTRFLIGMLGGAAAAYTLCRSYEAAMALQTPQRELPEDALTYGRLRRGFMLAGIVRSSALLGAFALSPAPKKLEKALARRMVRPFARRCAFIAMLMVAESMLELPIGYAEDFEVERRYGLGTQSASGWLRDRLLGTVLSSAISAPLLALAWGAVARWPKTWPWALSLAAPPLLAGANIVLPLYISPLFNTFEPYSGALADRLRALASQAGVPGAEILQTDMSKRTRKANAYVIGLFSTHRIVIGDTLLKEFEDDEVAFIIAHELGHYVAKDTWKGVALGSAAISLIAFAARGLVGNTKSGSATHVMRLLAAGSLVAQAATPFMAAATRQLEWAADHYARRVSGDPQAGIRAFERLRRQNMAEAEQPAWMELLFATHPSLRRRIAALQNPLQAPYTR